ncbi:MAG: mechanosensitive ion channel family protein [Myxococcales bacterium]|nr:MAG: mechanosensitive ion channel family protein [Myxococcales bacterium]
MDLDASKYIDPLIEYGPKVLGVLLALFFAWVIASWTERGVRAGLERRNFDATLTRFFAKLARYVILIGAVLGCLGVFGIQTASFAAVLAAAGFAIGLAFQGTLGNFSAGVMLLVFRPFKVGDFVEVSGETGTCEHIDLFTCEFRTLDNKKLIIPNGAVFGSTITNYTGYDIRRVDINVGAIELAGGRQGARFMHRDREARRRPGALRPDWLLDSPPAWDPCRSGAVSRSTTRCSLGGQGEAYCHLPRRRPAYRGL